MALTHLVDTSVLTRLQVAEVRGAVEPLASAGVLARTSISDLEIGYSARNAREWDSLVGRARGVDRSSRSKRSTFAAHVRSSGSSPRGVSVAGRFPIS